MDTPYDFDDPNDDPSGAAAWIARCFVVLIVIALELGGLLLIAIWR